MKKDLPFAKMHGLGNDFVVINAIEEPADLDPIMIKQLADRHVGIGFDQLLIIEPSKQANFFCRIFNGDGSQAEQCGNGLRCVARFLHEENIISKPFFTLETIASIYPVVIQDYEHIRVTMGIPTIQAPLKELTLSSGETLPVSLISTGNPHAIVNIANIHTIVTLELSSLISSHVSFPHGANVGFMNIRDNHHMELRTFERGVGETLACGSNACAAAAAGIINQWLQSPVSVAFRGGTLIIEWEAQDKPLHMIGPAARVFTGVLDHFRKP